MDNDDLTSINSSSDDVFSGDTSSKVKDDSKFSRNNPLRRQVYLRNAGQHEESVENDMKKKEATINLMRKQQIPKMWCIKDQKEISPM